MNINANVGLKDRSRVTLSGFRGLDTLSTAVDVKAINATYMQNLIARDGVNHKRYGWKTKFRIRSNDRYPKIQGIFNFTIFHEDFLIVYADTKFWAVDVKTESYYNITTKPLSGATRVEVGNVSISPVDTSCLTDSECKCFLNGNKAYFIGCGDFLVFSKWNNGLFELRRVEGNEDVYIPTTTENIGCEEDGGHYTRITAEERNILSPYHYNLLFGRQNLSGTNVATYYLDSKDFTDIEVEVQRKDNSSIVLKNTNIGATTTAGTFNYNINDKLKFVNIRAKINAMERTASGQLEYTMSGFGSCSVKLSIPNTFFLCSMKNGDSLVIKQNVNSYSMETYWIDDATSVNYEYPKTITYSLVYIKSNKQEKVLQTIQSKNATLSNISVNKSNYTVYVLGYLSIDYGTISCDLTNENAEILAFGWGEGSADIYEVSFTGYLTIETGGIELIDASGTYRGEIFVSEGKLILKPVTGDASAYAPIVPDQPNIKVKLKRSSDASIINTAIKGCEFGAQGGTDRLFLVDNVGNIVRWSKDEDFTYFGEKSWCVCGTSDKKITGMDRLNDSTLLIVKEYSPREPSIFIITGNILTGETEAGTVDYVALFSPHGYQVGMGAVGEIVNFNGDCLMVAKDGIYAVSLGENMTVDSRYILHRSRQISNKLEKFDLASAKCISYESKFFVYVGGEENEVYVADNKYTASFKGDMQNVVNYEWWRWTNIPISVFGFVKNELWFGTNDGQLCCFSENFYDEIMYKITPELITYSIQEDGIEGFSLNENIKVQNGDLFKFACDFYGEITTSKFECVGNETRFYLPLNDFAQGETIYIEDSPYVIDIKDLYFAIPYTTKNESIKFYRNYKNKALTVDSIEYNVITLRDKYGQCPKWASVITNGGLNPSTSDFTAKLINRKAVIAKWVSGAMDLGTRTYSKSLTHLTVTGEKDLSNRFRYGLKTRLNNREYELLRANNDLDFNKLDLETISLDSEFASSYTKKLNIRNINFVMLYFVSETIDDIALNSVQIEFKLHKRNIGVR